MIIYKNGSLGAIRLISSSFFIIMLSIVSIFSGIISETLRLLIMGCDLFIFLIYFISFTLYKRKIYKLSFEIIMISFPLIGIYLIWTIIDPNFNSIKIAGELVLLISFIVGCALVKWDNRTIIIMSHTISMILVCHLLWLLSHGLFYKFKGASLHSNELGLYVFISIIYTFIPYIIKSRVIDRFFATIGFISGLVVLFATSSRASLISFFVSILTIILWPKIIKTKWRFLFYFILLMMIVIIVPYIYIEIENSQFIYFINQLSRKYFDKNILSGRQMLWPAVFNAIAKNPIFGEGLYMKAGNLINKDWSAHNLFLQVLFQTGLIGLFFLFIFLIKLWMMLWNKKKEPIVKLTASLFSGLIIHETFEVSLIQNNMNNVLIGWLLICIGLSCIQNRRYTFETNNIR